jgi:hypothetical protein
MELRRTATLLCAILLPMFVSVGGQEPAAPPPMPAPAADTLVGTMRSVDYRTNTVEILTGVGLAIWIERVHVAPTVIVTIEGRPHPLADLRRGQVLRVAYRRTELGNDAISVDVVPAGGVRR